MARRVLLDLGIVDAELLRRVDARIPPAQRTDALSRVTESFARDLLASSARQEPLGQGEVTPRELLAAAAAVVARWIEQER